MPKPLKRYPLKDCAIYTLRTRKKLAKLLFTSEASIQNLLKRDDLYKRKWKHKKHDDDWLKKEPTSVNASDYRPIDIPTPKLKKLQSRISDLLSRVEPPEYLFSPVKRRSYVDNAKIHKDSAALWSLDIADFFPSCSANNVAWFFTKVMKCEPDVVKLLIGITTLNGSLPQGSPCSPILAYYSNFQMWDDIKKLVDQYNCILSIYADDITISGNIVPKLLIWRIKQRVFKQNLTLKDTKEKNAIHNSFEVTGVIVYNGKTLLPFKKQKLFGEVKRELSQAKSPKLKATLENKYKGRITQRDQVEN